MSWKLHGTPGSLYTGKARSYLVKQQIPFENRAAGEHRFREELVPRLGRWIIPVLEGTDGTLVQDFHLLPRRNALHVLNAPSPGATASLAIGEEIAGQIAAAI